MSLFPPLNETWMISLECSAGLRFLEGDTSNGSVRLVERASASPSGTKWAVTTLTPTIVKFRCTALSNAPTPLRFLDGRPHTGKVGLRPMLAAPPSGEWWEFRE